VNETGWRITPYAWLPVSIDLDSTVDGTTVPIDMDLGDVFDTFDVFALSARAEYWWGQYGVVLDGIWTDLQGKDIKNPAPPIQTLKIDVQDGILDMMAAYRLAIDSDGSVRFMGGARYHYIKQEITITPATPPGGPQMNLGGSKDFMELVLGGQYVQPFANRWLFTARGDISGFGIGSGSDITLSALAGFGYEITSNWVAELGYRYYYIDYSTGSGASEFGQDGNMHGPWIGIAYQR
jgi:opacity protein-like surface antigen